MIQFTDFYDDIGFIAALFYNDMLNNMDIYEIANRLTSKISDDNLSKIIINGVDDNNNKKLFEGYLIKLNIKFLQPKKALIAKVFYYILHNRIDLNEGIRCATYDVSDIADSTNYIGDDTGIEYIVGDYYAIDDGNLIYKKDIKIAKKLIFEGMQKYIHENLVNSPMDNIKKKDRSSRVALDKQIDAKLKLRKSAASILAKSNEDKKRKSIKEFLKQKFCRN
jgi:hypothetical protein